MAVAPHTLAHWQTQLAAGRISSRELTEQALDAAQADRVSFLAVHAQAARATADATDRLRAAGVPLPPLAGLPLSIKDLFDEAGQVTRAGSSVLASAAPAAADSTVVQRLRAAGAVIVGRTNMTEFAFSGLGLNPHYGTPRTPWDRATGRIAGGSSSGAAVSVADGAAVAAIGTDTGGSVRIPSALCGLTGFKPTARRVPMDGVLPLSPTLDSVGPLARSVACCALLDAVLAGEPWRPLPPASLAGLRLALPRTLVREGMDARVGAAFEAACGALSAAGATVVEIDVPEFAQLAHLNRAGGFIAAEAWAWHARLLETAGEAYDPRVAARIRRGASITAADYLELQQARARWIADVTSRLAEANAAAFVMPTVPIVAPPVAQLEADDEAFTRINLLMLRNPTFINFLDGCAVTLPCHRAGEAPVGLMLAAPGGQDRRLLALAAAAEAVLPARH
ncbi:amidase [Ramlibacter rhizophilus]|uniref:Amidase n=1 Tax=Ramlibacter rhizophilus TaxID=1781167 RepID=A0A4Z0BSB8_9BURK|nr:amidase [Ramlibacter rhizophilus]TFZ01158.1 amidase [Ramlibacter rhizophilus]